MFDKRQLGVSLVLPLSTMSGSQDVGIADQGTTAEEASTAGAEENGDLPRELASTGRGTINDTAV